MLSVSEAIMVDGHHEVVIAIGTTAFNLGNLWRHGLSHARGDQERPSNGTKCAFHRRFRSGGFRSEAVLQTDRDHACAGVGGVVAGLGDVGIEIHISSG